MSLATPTPAPDEPNADITNVQWAALIIEDLNNAGAKIPNTINNENSILQWMASENSPSTWTGTAGANNPLNNGLGSGGGDGTGSYPDLTTAANYVAQQLLSNNNGYGAIRTALEQNVPNSVFEAAVVASDWASGHYNGGAAWFTGNVPTVTASASAAAGATKGVKVGVPGTVLPGTQGTGTDAGGAVPGLNIPSFTSLVPGIGTILGDLTSGNWWKRIGIFLLGAGLTITGVYLFAKDTDTGKTIKSGAEGAVGTAALAAA